MMNVKSKVYFILNNVNNEWIMLEKYFDQFSALTTLIIHFRCSQTVLYL